MYKKFLVPMLLTVALAGCGHQSSDKQGDQTDTALPVQDQITNPAPTTPANGLDQTQQSVNPSAEPTQPPPATTDTTQPAAGTSTTTPDTSTTTTPTPSPATDKGAATSTGSDAGTTK